MIGGPVGEPLRSALAPIFGDLLERVRLSSGFASRAVVSVLRADAFVLGRRVFLSRAATEQLERRSREAVALLAHELTHVAQYRRLGVPVFLARYLREYARQRLAGVRHAEAYRNISFEREARDAEHDAAAGPRETVS